MNDKKHEESINKLDVEDMVSVGKVRDSHGLKGELFVVTNLDQQPPWLNKLTMFSLKFQNPTEEGKHQPVVRVLTVKKIRPHKKGFIVKSEEINDRNESDLCKGALFYIDKALVTSTKGEKIYLTEIKDFLVFDGEKELGPIVSFSTNNAQDLLVIRTNGGVEIEIPFVEKLVKKIDWDHKHVVMELPEGLY